MWTSFEQISFAVRWPICICAGHTICISKVNKAQMMILIDVTFWLWIYSLYIPRIVNKNHNLLLCNQVSNRSWPKHWNSLKHCFKLIYEWSIRTFRSKWNLIKLFADNSPVAEVGVVDEWVGQCNCLYMHNRLVAQAWPLNSSGSRFDALTTTACQCHSSSIRFTFDLLISLSIFKRIWFSNEITAFVKIFGETISYFGSVINCVVGMQNM